MSTFVARLRDLIEPDRGAREPARIIVLTQGGYLLDLGGEQLDLAWFDDLAGRGRQARAAGDHDTALDLFARALECWRGPVFVDVDARLSQHPAAVAAAGRRLDAGLAYADLSLELGRAEPAVVRLRALTAEAPLHEGLHARLVLALASTGQQAAALELFAGIRDRLAEELGIEPSAGLQAAHLRVLRQETTADPAFTIKSTAAASGPPTPAQLPADVAAFTGRTRQLQHLDVLLPAPDGTRASAVVISGIAGSAGVGKTALAVHWAHRIRDRFPDGQLYVNLRGYAPGSPMRPIEALAQFLRSLGIAPERVPVDTDEAAGLYRSLLAGKQVLVLLDNAASAEQVRPLLPGDRACMVVVTSRDRLTGLVARNGAHLLTLDVLTPAEAHTLLMRIIDRHRRPADARATAELAQLCAYLPLALRIAAAHLAGRTRQTVADYVAELRAGNRFAALEADEDEQTAVRAAFDLSYLRLNPEAQRLFRRLGLAPCHDVTAASAAALTRTLPRQAARTLDQLAAAHLIGQPAPGRFACHDLLQRYAAERAHREDTKLARQRAIRWLYDHYLQTADAAARLLYPGILRLPVVPPQTGPQIAFDDHRRALAWLDAEHPNLVTVIKHAAEHGPQSTASLLADAVRGYFQLRAYTVDWSAVAQAGLAAAESDGDLRAQVAGQLSLADLHRRQSRHSQAIEHNDRALVLARQSEWPEAQSVILNRTGIVYRQLGRLREALLRHTWGWAIDSRTGRLEGQAAHLDGLATVYRELGWLTEAMTYHTRALDLAQRIKSRMGQAIGLGNLGATCHALGLLDQALDHLGRALALHREIGNRSGEADCLRGLAAVHRDVDRHTRALELANAARTLAQDIGDARIEADTLNTLGTTHHHLASYRQAVDHHQRALHLAQQTGNRLPEAEALIGIATALSQLQQPDQALSYTRDALVITRRVGYRMLEAEARTLYTTIDLTRH